MTTAVRRQGAAMDMTEGSPAGLILRFALPLLMGSVFQQVYSLTDTAIAGQFLGESALAAIGATSAMYSLLIGLANGISNGCGIVLARVFGTGDEKHMRRASAVMLTVNFGVAAVMTALALGLARPILSMLQTPEDIFEQAMAYMSVICGGMCVTVMYNTCAGFMRALGNSRAPLCFLVISCMVNLCLDVVFIVVLHAGVAGTAWATVIAQGLSTVLSFAYMRRSFRTYLPGRGDFIPDRPLIVEMTTTGLSMGLMSSVYSIGSVMMQGAINALGSAVIAANTGARRILMVAMSPMVSLATAGATFISQNRGAGKMARVRRGIVQTVTQECVWAAMATVLLSVGSPFMVQMLLGSGSDEVATMAVMNLRINAVMLLPLGVLFALRQVMQAMGMRVVPVLCSGIELLTKLICTWFIVPRWGYLGASWGEPSSWPACALFLVVVYAVVRPKLFSDLEGSRKKKSKKF